MNYHFCRNSHQHWNADQSWHYESTWQAATGSSREGDASRRCVRTYIRRNAYNDQSFCRADLFDGDKWNRIVDWPIGIETGFADVSYAQSKFLPAYQQAFEAAERMLLKEVDNILTTHAP